MKFEGVISAFGLYFQAAIRFGLLFVFLIRLFKFAVFACSVLFRLLLFHGDVIVLAAT